MLGKYWTSAVETHCKYPPEGEIFLLLPPCTLFNLSFTVVSEEHIDCGHAVEHCSTVLAPPLCRPGPLSVHLWRETTTPSTARFPSRGNLGGNAWQNAPPPLHKFSNYTKDYIQRWWIRHCTLKVRDASLCVLGLELLKIVSVYAAISVMLLMSVKSQLCCGQSWFCPCIFCFLSKCKIVLGIWKIWARFWNACFYWSLCIRFKCLTPVIYLQVNQLWLLLSTWKMAPWTASYA